MYTQVQSRFSPTVPTILKHTEIQSCSYDKIFASTWLSSDHIVCGTKCNQIIVCNTESKKLVSIPVPQGPSKFPRDSCGIHTISINPSRNSLATGALSPLDIAIFDIPSFTPKLILTGHKDWVFGVDFISDHLLVSGGRDSVVGFWSIKESEPQNQIEIRNPLAFRFEHTQKVRDIKFHRVSSVIYLKVFLFFFFY